MLWRRLDSPGHEFCRLSSQDSGWHLSGTAVFAHNLQPCQLDYLVVCDSGWRTLSGRVVGFVGDDVVKADISVDSDSNWRLNEKEFPGVKGCVDLDLAFSPSTNLLPIRRLNLDTGQEAEVKAAWLSFPSFTLEPLEQLYRCISPATYQYESTGASFVTELRVNEIGFITHYPNLWQAEASI